MENKFKKQNKSDKQVESMQVIMTELENVRDHGGFFDDAFYNRLMTLDRTCISWDLFNVLVSIPDERYRNFWASANMAKQLLSSYIKSQFDAQNGKGNRGAEAQNYEDFLMEVLCTIRECLPKYDVEKSPNFFSYIKFYISHVGYTFNNDGSVYYAKTKGYRVYSKETLLENKTEGDGSLSDAFGDMEDPNADVEKVVQKKEDNRASEIFSRIAINGITLGSTEQDRFHEYINIAKGKEALVKKTNMEIAEINKACEKKEISTKERTEKVAQKKRELVSELKIYEKFDREEQNRLFSNTIFWCKFMGGVNNWPAEVLDVIRNEVSTEMEDLENIPNNDYSEEA